MLAQGYCASCHAFPEPSLLPKETWAKKVLPQMAAYMGFKAAQDSLGIWEEKTAEEIAILRKLDSYPASSQLPARDFQAIVAYYGQEAPVELPAQIPKVSPEILEHFAAKELFIEGIKSPQTSLVAINEERGELLISDAGSLQLYAKDTQDELFTLPPISSPAVHFLKRSPNVYDFITIGSIAPSDLSQGAVYQIDLNEGTWGQVMDDLARPVYGLWEDLEKDGKPDLLLCNYGHHGGGLVIYPDGDAGVEPTRLGGAGARRVEVADLNRDGVSDIVALFCQGDERISVFYGKGGGDFEPEKILLRFPPVMGSSYFELRDMDGDGALDILLSNGDNWDYSSVLKPYHGFRIYTDQGGGRYEEAWFYPQYGAAKMMALDFDGDGDLDLATIAFYDELAEAEQQFLLFENLGGLGFRPFFIPEASLAKWLTMDVGDLDGDGDADIVLGAYAHNTLEYTKLLLRGISEIPNVLILENNLSGK
ncbi:VCBS repeat-containing protein [Algoriphagus sp. H41]|uniref:VCBS repeat-containing protein n=2 Tax=Algoriphagus oliviformis TaxID=2811231 RepID=A0ABS3C7G4_9BACT|nr:VCBS repeat-containing protein [Algoriphagus oliviformis]